MTSWSLSPAVCSRVAGPGTLWPASAGDEFAILLEQVGGPEDATRVAKRVTQVLGRPLSIAGHDMVPRASVGVAIATPEGDAEALLHNADSAMYSAKAAADSTYALFDPDTLVAG